MNTFLTKYKSLYIKNIDYNPENFANKENESVKPNFSG